MKVYYLIGKYVAAATTVLSLGYLAIDGSRLLLPPNDRSPQITAHYQKNVTEDVLCVAGGIFGFKYFNLKVKENNRANSGN
jgi:hypothetical protein